MEVQVLLPTPRGISSVGRAPALQAGCQRFESAILHEFLILTMSLISQKDRLMVIEALEYYILSLKTYHTPDENKIYQYSTLLNWIKLEHSKNIPQ